MSRLPTSRLITSLGVLLFSHCLFALPEDADQPIHIQAENVEIDEQAQQAIYRGSVRVDQGTLRVTADELIVEILMHCGADTTIRLGFSRHCSLLFTGSTRSYD